MGHPSMNGVEKESPKIRTVINLPDNHLQNYKHNSGGLEWGYLVLSNKPVNFFFVDSQYLASKFLANSQ